MNSSHQCPCCFTFLEEGESRCPECGAREDARNPEELLPIGTVLNDRFCIGQVLHHNDLLTTYLAWDTVKERKVRVEEFFPGILKRGEDGCRAVLISAESKTQFRTMASDLHDRWKRLLQINHKAMLKTVVLFSENDTLYRVTEYLRMIPLEEYLQQQNGPLSLSDAKILIGPVISLLSQIHNMGLIHCGISPQNILVDFRRRVVLDAFALPELRTLGGGLKAELYAGYSAPEQYSKALWQGEWTDIYSVAAVLYRMLTGKDPASAELRGEKDPLVPMQTLCPDLPSNAADAIMRAMDLDQKTRFRTMESFSVALLQESDANTAVFRPESRAAKAEEPVTAKKESRGTSLPQLILAGLLLISIAGNIFLGIRGNRNNGIDPLPAVPIMEQDYTGYYLPAIQEQLEMTPQYNFNYRYEYSDTYPQGVIYKQSLTVGQVLPEDGSVTLFISKGKGYLEMPDLLGANETYAMRVLTDLQIQYSLDYEADPESGGEEGTVVYCSVKPGDPVRPKTAADPDTVIVTVKERSNGY